MRRRLGKVKFILSALFFIPAWSSLWPASSLWAQQAQQAQETPGAAGRKAISGNRFEHLTGLKMEKSQKLLWDQKYSTTSYIYGKSPDPFLSENYPYLPPRGHVLDMGMGEGRNAVFLARKGYQVTGIDISSVAVKKALNLAKEFGVTIKTIEASLKDYPFREAEFDAIICLYYLDRTLIKDMQRWLKPGGIIIFGSYTTSQAQVKDFDMTKYKIEHFLRPQELLNLFPGMRILKYEEPQHLKNFAAHIILKK